MKETNFRKKDIRYLHFEVARLRTIYDSQPEIRDRIVKRYRLLVKEYGRRGLVWFWTKHILDKLIKDEFGGHKGKWITLEGGQHVFIREGETVREATERLKPSKEKPKFEDSKYFKQTKEGVEVELFRHGRENTDEFRGGTWYENKLYEGQRGSYEEGGAGQKPIGVGGRSKHERKVVLSKPYYLKWEEGHTEGRIVVDMGIDVLGRDKTKKLSRGILGYKAEEVYAKIERGVSEKLSSEGYDGVVFYTKVGKAPPYPNQTFIFKEKTEKEKKEKQHTTSQSEGSWEPRYSEEEEEDKKKKKTVFGPKDKVEKVTFQGHKGKWVTLEGGQKLFIREGETLGEATGRLREKKPKFKDVDFIGPYAKDKEASIKEVKEVFKELPSEHFEGIDTILIGSEEKMDAAGRYHYPGVVSIREDYLLDRDIARSICYHEVGHHVYTKNNAFNWPEFWTENKKSMPNSYSKTSPSEGFSECYAKYYRGKAKTDIFFAPLDTKIKRWFDNKFEGEDK